MEIMGFHQLYRLIMSKATHSAGSLLPLLPTSCPRSAGVPELRGANGKGSRMGFPEPDFLPSALDLLKALKKWTRAGDLLMIVEGGLETATPPTS